MTTVAALSPLVPTTATATRGWPGVSGDSAGAVHVTVPGEIAAKSMHSTPPTVTLTASTSMPPPMLLPMEIVIVVPASASGGTTAARRGRIATVTTAGSRMGAAAPATKYDSSSGMASASGAAAAMAPSNTVPGQTHVASVCGADGDGAQLHGAPASVTLVMRAAPLAYPSAVPIMLKVAGGAHVVPASLTLSHPTAATTDGRTDCTVAEANGIAGAARLICAVPTGNATRRECALLLLKLTRDSAGAPPPSSIGSA